MGDSEMEYIFRKYGDGTYGVGETIVDGVVLFRDGFFNLTLEEAQALLAKKTNGAQQ
jgi:hypothetical protein